MKEILTLQVVVKMMSLSTFLCLSACVTTSSNSGKSEGKQSPLSFDAIFGVSYNDNISINEIDANLGQGDELAYFSGRVKFDQEIGENTEFDVSYRFSANAHQDFSRFDTQTHLVSTGIKHDFGGFDAGVSYQYADSALDNDGFLTLNQISPYVTKYFGKKAYVRAFYGYVDKGFDGRPERDATVNKGGADLYYFIDGVKRYIQTGYNYEDVDAIGPEFDHGAHNLKLHFIQRVEIGGRDGKFEAGWRYENRDYDNITPSINMVRDDERHRFQAEFELPITDNIYSKLELEHATNSSNLPSADFNRNTATIGLGVRY